MTDVAPAIRSAILNDVYINSRVTAVYTRLPVPEGATHPCVVIPFNSVTTNQDALINKRTVIIRDVMVYGNVGAPGSADDQTRVVDEVAFALRRLFHRSPDILGNQSYHVIDIVVNGPQPAPTDDDKKTGRMVNLTLRIQDDS